MKDKYNFKIGSPSREVSIRVSSEIFPIPVILHAAYYFIDEAKVIAEKGKKDEVIVTLIPEQEMKEPDLENLAYEFNIQLISSFVEEEESRKHVGVRDTMMKAALLPPISSQPPKKCS